MGAYEEIVRRYRDPALRVAYVVTGSAADAEDVAQEAFVKAYRALSRHRSAAPLRPWLLAIVTNEARNARKAAGRRIALAMRAPAEHDSPSAEAAAVAEDERARLLAAVNRLSEDDRLIIGYRYFAGLSESETAEALHLPRGTVKSRLSRALDRLRRRLADVAPVEEVEQ